jgi:translation initiation factor IF-2
MLSEIDHNIPNIVSQYKIAISIDDIYDTLFCAACGCSVLTPEIYNNSLTSVYTITDYNNIITQINNINNDDISIKNIKDTQNFIKLNYDSIDLFYKAFNSNILNNLKYRIPNL